MPSTRRSLLPRLTRSSRSGRRSDEPRSGGLAGACARLAASGAFNFAIFGVIVANAAVLGLETYDSIERSHGGLLNALNDVFLGIFVVELAIRFAAYGSRPQGFFRSGWNVFDLVVIGAAFVPGIRENATLLRLARLARVVRLVRLLPDLRVLVLAVGRSLPGVASLGVITVLMLYLYGMLGWLIFGDFDPEAYGTIGQAMLTLFVLLSLESLPDQVETGLELSSWTVLYYISFTLIAAFLLLNILIGVVINSLEEAREIEAKRDQDERRRRALETPGSADDREVAIVDRVAALRTALEELEREVGSTPARSRAGPRR